MQAIAVFPGQPNSSHLADLPLPDLGDVPNGRGVLVRILQCGVDGTDKEIIAAEIKIDARSPVIAFGQATAYRLFSTKSYIVLPKHGQEADLDRVEALAVLFGIGLVVFDGPPTAPRVARRRPRGDRGRRQVRCAPPGP